MSKKQPKSKWWQTFRKALSPLVVAWIFSFALHAVMTVSTQMVPTQRITKATPKPKPPVKIRMISNKKPLERKISETPLAKTKAPDPAKSRWGKQTHRTEKETRVRPAHSQKAAEAVAKASPKTHVPVAPARSKKPSPSEVSQSPKPKGDQKSRLPSKPKLKISSATQPNSTVRIQAKTKSKNPKSKSLHKQRTARNAYEALLNGAVSHMTDLAQTGYQESLDEKIELGEAIDINTSHYRYIGYFSSMRKAIEMVWDYPRSEAKQGHQGHVGLKFTIRKDGQVQKVRVTESSGHEMLDDAIVEAVRQAAPFSPLPDGFGRKKLVVMGTFRYVLGY